YRYTPTVHHNRFIPVPYHSLVLDCEAPKEKTESCGSLLLTLEVLSKWFSNFRSVWSKSLRSPFHTFRSGSVHISDLGVGVEFGKSGVVILSIRTFDIQLIIFSFKNL